MKQPYLLPVLLLFTTSVIAQKDTAYKYLDADLNFTSKNNAVYHSKVFSKGDHWEMIATYNDGSPLVDIVFKDKNLRSRDGYFAMYYPKNVKMKEGYFEDNIQLGLWKSWYSTGILKDSGSYNNGFPSGLWKSWYENGILGAIINYLKDSTGTSRKMEWYREDGSLSSKETYINEKLTVLECFNEKNEYTGASCSIQKPAVFIHPFYDAVDYILDRLYREKIKTIKGDAIASFSFIVSKDGKIKDLTITYSSDSALSLQVIKIISQMPAWSPAISHNRVIEYLVEITVPYYKDPKDAYRDDNDN